ncbi:MAG: hypothetical protein J0L92_23890 [Deltaproteobacteria bacterium]|nr:hypothetical protein [Deltaproteobacteria bacterium]
MLRCSAPWCVIVVLLVAASAGAEDATMVRLVVPEVPAAMTGELRDTLADMLVTAGAIGELARVGGARREPCGITFRSPDRVLGRASLVWRGGRIVERLEWDTQLEGHPIWRRRRSFFHDGRVVRELGETMQYQRGEADCPSTTRRVVSRDARGRITSVRSTVDTCEGVDSGTTTYRHVWRHRPGFEEAIVRSRHEGDDGPMLVTTRAMVPSERDAWANVGGEGRFSTWLDVRDSEGFLRVRIEDEQGVGEYVYACDGSEWPRGPRAPEVLPTLD